MVDVLKKIYVDDCCVNCSQSHINCYGQEHELGGMVCDLREEFVAHNNWCERHERHERED